MVEKLHFLRFVLWLFKNKKLSKSEKISILNELNVYCSEVKSQYNSIISEAKSQNEKISQESGYQYDEVESKAWSMYSEIKSELWSWYNQELASRIEQLIKKYDLKFKMSDKE